MKKIILAILTVFMVTGVLVVDSQADCYRRHRAYRTGSAVVVSPRPYHGYYYSSVPVVIQQPAPVVYLPPSPVVYLAPPWLPGISVFFPGVNIHIR